MEAVLQVGSYNLVFTASTTPSSGEKESAFAVLYYKTANAAKTKFNKTDECVGSVPRNACFRLLPIHYPLHLLSPNTYNLFPIPYLLSPNLFYNITMYTIPPDFSDFISPNCNRATFIQNFLNKAGLDAPILQIEGKNHIYVKFPQAQYNPMFRIKTVIAHYDRIGIGANDNSAAVFCLMQWAAELARVYSADCMTGSFHNIRLIFTDGEELGAGEGVKEQGAFALAALFKRLSIADEDIFVFDCMGRGTVPVICQSHIPKTTSKAFIKQYSGLEQRAETIIKNASQNWFKLPTSYSDNAGFIANGIPAVAITMLPADEAEAYCRSLTNIPPTWKMLHTQNDNLQNLTPEAFEITERIIQNLAALKTIKC